MIYQLMTCRYEIKRRQWAWAWICKYVFRIQSPSAAANGYDYAWDWYKSIKRNSGWHVIGTVLSDGDEDSLINPSKFTKVENI